MPALHTVVPPAPSGLKLIPRLESHDEALLPELAELGVATVACTAVQPELAAAARGKHGLELLVDPACRRNQLPPEQRPPGFADLGYAIRGVFDPDVDRLSPEQERAYVRAVLEVQRRAGAARTVSPSHLAGGPASPSRSLDLRLARVAADQLRARSGGGRDFLVGLTVSVDVVVEPVARAWLAARYAAIHDRFLVEIDGLSDASTADEVRAGCEILAGLREAGAREIVLVGGQDLAWAIVGSGLADSVVLALGDDEAWRLRVADFAALTDDVLANERLLQRRLRAGDPPPQVRDGLALPYAVAAGLRRRLARQQLER